ncbi:MAG: 3-deoxy-8-phosphooctulonate synthase [Bacteroidetes bacterium]|nr:3-deoxy-8-phosphooctulonate synthase [Bacteroidota bacterium]MBU2507559.1 3-deoxy-8-phosphooctulonate synthase [Bacteroidota bacterium]
MKKISNEITLNEYSISIGNNKPLVLIAGPCVVEGEKITLQTAEKIKEITGKLNIPYIFKASYKKANRTSGDSFATIGVEESIKILEKVKKEFHLPVLTDIHSPQEASNISNAADILQIPAFLCRQTDLLIAAGMTGKVVNIKKGQFLAPEDMKHAAEKVLSTGNSQILLTERGTTFGYHNLVVDMRSLLIMRELGFPVVMDATHSVQMPGSSNITGGQPKFIKPLARAAAAVGIDALFLEVHPDPANAKSDSASQLPLNELEETLKEIMEIDSIVKRK